MSTHGKGTVVNKKKVFGDFKDRILKKEIKQFNIVITGRENKNKKMYLKSSEEFVNRLYVVNDQGKREYNEDRISVLAEEGIQIYMVMDGHGGSECVDSLFQKIPHWIKKVFLEKLVEGKWDDEKRERARHYLIDMFVEIQNRIQDGKIQVGCSGSTLNAVVIFQEQLIVINIGDSRAIALNDQFSYTQLSMDNKPNEPFEKDRIEKEGGVVTNEKQDVPRVQGLALSRTLGDKDCEHAIEEPDIYFYNKKDFLYFIIASDGLFDIMSNQGIIEEVNSYIIKNHDNSQISINPVYHIFKNVIKTPTSDNISIVMVLL